MDAVPKQDPQWLEDFVKWVTTDPNLTWIKHGVVAKKYVSEDEYDRLVKLKNQDKHSNKEDRLIALHRIQEMYRTQDEKVLMFEDSSCFNGSREAWYMHMARGVRHDEYWDNHGENSMTHFFNLKLLRRWWMKVSLFPKGTDRMTYALEIQAQQSQTSEKQDAGNRKQGDHPLVQRLTYLHKMVQLYGFHDIYDDKTVRLKDIHVRREAILHQLLTISGIF